MKKVFLSVSVLAAATLGSKSYAQNAVERLLDDNPSLNKFEVLKKFYEEAKQPAGYADFDEYKGAETKACIVVFPKSPDNFSNHSVLKVVIRVPEAGPLFPENRRTKVVDYANERGDLVAFSQKISMRMTPTDLIENLYDYEGSAQIISSTKYRKNGDLVVFATTIDDVVNSEISTYYGYCFPKQ